MEKPRTVLVDQYALSELGADRGLGRYTSLLSAGVKTLSGLSIRTLKRTGAANRLPDTIDIQMEIRKLGLDPSVPYHSTSVYHLPLLKNRPWICSIQDVIPLDLADYRKLGLKSRLLFRNARRSDLIVANSEYTRSRIVEKLKVSSERVVMCPLPIANEFFAPPSQESLELVSRVLAENDIDSGDPYVVALADTRTPDTRKRYHWINEVAEGLARKKIPMVVTGRGLVASDFPSCSVIQSLPDDLLSALYTRAVAMYYPTAYEGQGLPPQEAMAAGCPVVAYRNTSVEEVVGWAGFLLEDPVPWELQSLNNSLPTANREEVVNKIESWIDSAAHLEEARKQARAMASRYSWDKFCLDLEAVYKSQRRGLS